jgi:hypothetical protein
MNRLSATLSRIIIVGTFITACAAQAEDVSQQTVAQTEVETVAELAAIKDQWVEDLQQKLTDSIKQQASSALNQVAQTVKALLP